MSIKTIINFFHKKTLDKFLVSVDYSLSIEEMTKSIRRYGWIHSKVTNENFPIEGNRKQEVELQLIKLKHKSSTEEILDEMKSRGLRAATLAELLAFDAKFPNMAMSFYVVALGSIWYSPDGYSYAPELGVSMYGRNVTIVRLPRKNERKWSRFLIRFLAAK